MIEQDFMGLEGFIWWYGVVEDRKDPLYLGRVKVRCIGFHTDDKIEIPTEELPWAEVIQPITSAAISGIGRTPTGLVEGTHVFGFFRDGREGQEPVVLGSSGGIPEDFANPNFGFYDPRNLIERKNAPYPPIHIDRFETGSPGKIINHNQVDENQEKYTFGGITPYANSTLFSSGTIDDKIQINAYKQDPKTGGVSENATHSSQIFSRHPDENRVIKDKDGNPLLSLPSTTLLALNHTRYYDENREQMVTTPQPHAKIQNYTHRITSVLAQTNKKLHTEVRTALLAEPDWTLPTDYIEPEYPYNHVTYTESGHLFEMDDSPGAERVRLLHRSQSFIEFTPTGDKVENVVGKSYFVSDSDAFTHILGNDVKHIAGNINWLFNSRKDDDNHILFAGGGLNMTLEDTGDFDLDIQDGDFIVNARNIRFIGSAEDEGASTFSLEKMKIKLWDPTNSQSIKSASQDIETGSSKLKAASIEESSKGSFKLNVGSEHEVTAENKSTEIVKGITGGMEKTCIMSPITLEAQNPVRGIFLNSGVEGKASQLKIDQAGFKGTSLKGDFNFDAKLGNMNSKVFKEYTVDAGTKINLHNKKAEIECDEAGLIRIKGQGMDIHTLFLKLINALKGATYGTGSGPSTTAIGDPFTPLETDLNKVFKA